MRISPLPLLLAVCLVLPGCFVVDELNAGKDEMDRRIGARAKPEVKKFDGPDWEDLLPTAKKKTAREVADDYWDTAQAIAPGELSEGIAKCQLDGSLQFMSQDDCLARGGTPQ
jgi:hypothetical protein